MNVGRLDVRLLVDERGVVEVPAGPDPHVVIHVGAPVTMGCERGGEKHRGTRIHGDVDIVPMGVASRWLLEKQDRALVVSIPQNLIIETAVEMGVDPARTTLLNRFQIRDARLEHLAWALKTELEQGFKNGRLYVDSIGTAMACQLLQEHSLASLKSRTIATGQMSAFKLRQVLGYIEDNLGADLSLDAIATISGLSLSHSQRAFRNATGLSIHQYVIQRRVERAKVLLAEQKSSIREIALMVGFSHQSHLAYHMRRLLGCSPMSMRKGNH